MLIFSWYSQYLVLICLYLLSLPMAAGASGSITLTSRCPTNIQIIRYGIPLSAVRRKAVSVSSPCCRGSNSPTWSIGSRRARLLTSSAALRSPQTCFRLPHCRILRGLKLPPVIVLLLWSFVVVVVGMRISDIENRPQSQRVCTGIDFILLFIVIYYISRQESKSVWCI